MKITKSQLIKLIRERQFRAGKQSHEPSFSLDDYPGYSDFYSGKSDDYGYEDDYDYDYVEAFGEDPDDIDDDFGGVTLDAVFFPLAST